MLDSYLMMRGRQSGPKKLFFAFLKIIAIFFIFAVAFFAIPSVQWIISHINSDNFTRGVLGETSITVEIVDNHVERLQGLSGRESIPDNHGMLFVFERINHHGIWMKDMNFPLDILWLNEHSEVVHIEKDVSQYSYPEIYRPAKPAKFVLELNSGFVSRNAIKLGDRFVLP